MVHEVCSSHSEGNPVLPCHLWQGKKKKKSYYPDISGSFSQEGRQNWIQQGTRTHAINLRIEWNCSCPSASYCWWSIALQSPTFSPSSSQQLFLPVHFVSAPVWQLFKVLYCKIKNIFFIFCLLYITCVQSITSLSQYSTIYLLVWFEYLC